MSVGDLDSATKGSAARFNDGKIPLDLIPVRILAAASERSLHAKQPGSNDPTGVSQALRFLALWQESNDRTLLLDASRALGGRGFGGIAWSECAQVFDYGRKKYNDWNWIKGQKWSVPLGCALRHLESIADGKLMDDGDNGSGLPHRGHFLCNMVMLYTFYDVYPEGNDIPKALTSLRVVPPTLSDLQGEVTDIKNVMLRDPAFQESV